MLETFIAGWTMDNAHVEYDSWWLCSVLGMQLITLQGDMRFSLKRLCYIRYAVSSQGSRILVLTFESVHFRVRFTVG